MPFFFSVHILPLNLDVPQSNTEQQNKQTSRKSTRLVHNDSTSSFYELLQKDNSFTIHHRNIQKLALEMYRVKHRIAPKMMCELFNEANVP